MVTFFKPTGSKTLMNKQLTLIIERLDGNGCGVASFNQKSVFIENTLPGEQVVAKVVEQSSKYIKAKLLHVNKPSEHRIIPHCKHFLNCGGCNLQHIAFEQHQIFKQDKVAKLFSRAGITDTLPWQAPLIDKSYHYRRKARIGVQYDKNGQAIVGFRQQATNHLVNIKRCAVLTPGIEAIFVTLKEIIDRLNTAKSIGHVEVIETDHITLVIRQLYKVNQADQQIWRTAAEQNQWHIYFDDGKQLSLLSNDDKKLSYSLLDQTKIDFSADDFIQVNHEINQLMVKQALEWLTLSETDEVLDLFCGLGNFSLPIAKQVASVYGVEGINKMVLSAADNAKINQLNNAHFYQADLNTKWSESAWSNKKYHKVLLDPARAGAEIAIQEVAKLGAEKILYVSCEPATLARDSMLLIKQGYKIEKIALMEMFSQTKHIETMVLFVPSI